MGYMCGRVGRERERKERMRRMREELGNTQSDSPRLRDAKVMRGAGVCREGWCGKGKRTGVGEEGSTAGLCAFVA